MPDGPLPFRLIVVTDWARTDLVARLGAALAAGPGVAVQHRHPDVSGAQFAREAEALATICAQHGAPLFINGRLDVALALGAHLHLPAHGPSVDDVRPHLPRRWLSVAVHDEREARAAQGADLALVSPVFSPRSKPTDTRPTLGSAGLARLAAQVGLPVFALGGVDERSVRGLACAGAAVIGAVLDAVDPGAATAALLDALPSHAGAEAGPEARFVRNSGPP